MIALSPAFLWGTVLLGVRLLPLALLLAQLTRGLVPMAVSVAWLLALIAGLAPSAATALPVLEPSLLLMAGARELCIGLAFALAGAAPLVALFWSGRIAEQQVFAPASVPFARLYTWAAVLLVLALGGHRALLSVLADSLVVLPLAGPSLQRESWLVTITSVMSEALVTALALGLPVWLALWLLDLTYALVERLRSDAAPVTRAPLRALLAQLLLVVLFAPLVSRAPEHMRAGLARARGVLTQLAR